MCIRAMYLRTRMSCVPQMSCVPLVEQVKALMSHHDVLPDLRRRVLQARGPCPRPTPKLLPLLLPLPLAPSPLPTSQPLALLLSRGVAAVLRICVVGARRAAR